MVSGASVVDRPRLVPPPIQVGRSMSHLSLLLSYLTSLIFRNYRDEALAANRSMRAHIRALNEVDTRLFERAQQLWSLRAHENPPR